MTGGYLGWWLGYFVIFFHQRDNYILLSFVGVTKWSISWCWDNYGWQLFVLNTPPITIRMSRGYGMWFTNKYGEYIHRWISRDCCYCILLLMLVLNSKSWLVVPTPMTNFGQPPNHSKYNKERKNTSNIIKHVWNILKPSVRNSLKADNDHQNSGKQWSDFPLTTNPPASAETPASLWRVAHT